MKNLATHDQNNFNMVDQTIKEELYLAGIPTVKVERRTGEVPSIYVGRIGQWELYRAWTYWVAKTEVENGLPLKLALELHNTKNPINDNILGDIIRSGGHGGAPSPDEYGANPIYNDELNEKLVALGYEMKYYEIIDKSYVSINVGEMSKICNEGKLDVERYVDCYHIDNQVGLNEFAKFINKIL